MCFCTPIIILQAFIGSRTGLAATILILLYFAIKTGGVRLGGVVFVYLILLVYVFNEISPLKASYWGIDILRNTQDINHASFNASSLGSSSSPIDKFSSFRLSIMESAFQKAGITSLFLGNGLNNFQGLAFERYWQVHNIYLRALGEFGIIGFLASVTIIAFPIFIRASSYAKQAAKIFCIVFSFIGLLHPEILLTGLSTCLFYWVAYAVVVSDAK